MRVGHIDLNTRDYAFIQADDMDDPDVWIPDDDVDRIGLPHGTTVLYLPRKTRGGLPRKTRGGWQVQLVDPDLHQVYGQRNRNPSLWQSGVVQRVFQDLCFIKPDVGPPNVMCLPSAVDDVYVPIAGQRVRFRAGPSEKDGSPYLQAIRMIKIDEQDRPSTPMHVYCASRLSPIPEVDSSESDTV